MRIEIRQATAADIPALAGVLARAFGRDQMVVWPFVTGEDLEARIRTHFEQLDGRLADEGWIHTAADGDGVMALIPPDSEARTRVIDAESVRGMAGLTPDGGRRYERFWTWIEGCHPDEPHWLLDQLAVDPRAQGRGIGRAMVELAAEHAAADGLPLFLETGTERNVALYRHLGFTEMLAADAPDGGPRVWFMRREPVIVPRQPHPLRVADPRLDQGTDGGERVGLVCTVRRDPDPLAVADAGAHEADHGDPRLERRGGLDEQRGRSGMQAARVLDANVDRGRVLRLPRLRLRRIEGML